MTRKTPLAAAELAVMKLLWRVDRMNAREILEAIYPDASRSQHGTVHRLLQRLEDKGFVLRDRTAPVQQFSARVSREAYLGGELESIAEQMTGGSLAPLITLLIEEKKLSRSEIQRLRKIVEEK